MSAAPFEILHLDNHLLVVAKPPGMPVQPDETGDVDVLTAAKRYLKEAFNKPGNVFLGLVHRLDRPASGVMVLGRTSKAAARLSEQFRTRVPEKDYLVVVEGSCPGAGVVRHHLVREGRSVRVVDHGHARARAAEMQWRSLGERDHLTLLAVRLETGRKHQIRVQLAAMGRPVLGDLRYGARRELDGRNLALHAYRLALMHPVAKTWMSFTAAPPRGWGTLFRTEIAAVLGDPEDDVIIDRTMR